MALGGYLIWMRQEQAWGRGLKRLCKARTTSSSGKPLEGPQEKVRKAYK